MRAAVRVSLLALGLLLAVAARAQTFVWTGLGSDNNVLTAANWQGNVAPTGSLTENWEFPVIFPSSWVQFYPTLTAPLSVNDLTFNHPSGFYTISGGSALTLGGDIALYSAAQISAPLVLTAGQHVIDAYVNGDSMNYGSLRIFGGITGGGGITKIGDGALTITGSSDYTGDTIIDDGMVTVGGYHPLGWGTIFLNGGFFQADSTGSYLPNDFVLGSSVTFSVSLIDGSFSLGNGDGSSIRPASGLTFVNLNLFGSSPLYLDGDMEDGDSGPTTYHFSGLSQGASRFYLDASNSYTGGTVVTPGASVIFAGSSSLPESGLVTVQAGGYVGLGSEFITPATFISRIDAANSYGTVGFDGLTVTDDVNLSALFNVSLGTRSAATLTGQITPAQGGNYLFMSSGRLYLTGTNSLTGNRDLSSETIPLANDPRGMLVLGQSVANDYSGETVANHAAIIFDQPGTLSANTSIALLDGGYVGFTETSGLTVEDIASQITYQDATPGVIGIDFHDSIFSYAGTPTTYSANIDLGNLADPVYLGTASHMTLTGDIFTTDDGTDDYFFTGYDGGQLTIQSQLTGSRAVHIGLPGEPNSYSSVTLDNSDNSFTGGIVLNSGVLFAPGPSSLGSGPITVDSQYTDAFTALVTSGTLFNPIDLQNSSTLDISLHDGPLELAGNISGNGSLAIRSLEGAQVTLSGANSYSGESIFGSRAVVTANSDTALGTSSVHLTEGAAVHFTTAAPVIGSLVEGSAYVYDVDGYYQQDAALIVGGGGPTSTLTINQGEDWGYFEGSILEDGTTLTLVKNGPGQLQINGNNYDNNNPYSVYSGGTVINAGVLVAGSADALGSGTITLNGATAALKTAAGVTLTNAITFGGNGGILGGNGTIATPITAGTNVVLAPGNSPGTLTFASGLTLAPGGSLNFEVQYANGAAGTGYDLVSISGGTLDITATGGTPFTIYLTSLNIFGGPGDVSDFSATTSYSWMLFEGNSGGGINNFNASSFTLDLSNFSNSYGAGVFSLAQGVNGGNPAIYLNFTAVPEPSTWALLGVGLAAGLVARRRRRRA